MPPNFCTSKVWALLCIRVVHARAVLAERSPYTADTLTAKPRWKIPCTSQIWTPNLRRTATSSISFSSEKTIRKEAFLEQSTPFIAPYNAQNNVSWSLFSKSQIYEDTSGQQHASERYSTAATQAGKPLTAIRCIGFDTDTTSRTLPRTESGEVSPTNTYTQKAYFESGTKALGKASQCATAWRERLLHVRKITSSHQQN